jgi:muramoyltetrapeptide carboxypeptidase LdcA involved in peptidoglycan recycling
MTDNVFTEDEKGRSSAGKVRAKQFEDFIRNPEIIVIFSAKEAISCRMLPFIDYDSIKK